MPHSDIFSEWLIDQQIAFCANIVASSGDSRSRPIRAIAGYFIQTQLSPFDEHSWKRLWLLSPSTLALLNYIDPCALKPSEDEGYDLLAIRAKAEQAQRHLLGNGTGEANRSGLVNYAVQLFVGDIELPQLFRWAQRSISKKWSLLAHASDLSMLDKELDVIRNRAIDVSKRYAAVVALDRWLREVYDPVASQKAPPLWDRIARGLISKLFYWPLLVSSHRGETVGLSLPIACVLKDGLVKFKNNVWFNIIGDRWARDPQSGEWGFHNSHLKFAQDWRTSFRNALHVAKALWLSQNSRTSEERREWVNASTIHVDLTVANQIVSAIYQEDGLRGRILAACPDLRELLSAPYPIEGQSATAYVAQVVLAMLLPGDAGPHGVATGGIHLWGDDLYPLTDVGGIEAKLTYVAAGFFSRVVLPDTKDVREAVESLYGSGQSTVEINYCTSARSAADALLSVGWRRALFSRTPAAQLNFYRTVHRLSEYAEQTYGRIATNSGGDYLSEEDLEDVRLDDGRASPINPDDVSKFAELLGYCTRTPNSIKFPNANGLLYLANEKFLGDWLGWLDHTVRFEHKGRGLSILCVRTTYEETDIRFWANIFELLGASDRQWRKFQWGNSTESAKALANVLNNFKQIPTISSGIAPDLLIIIDDGKLTQAPTNVVYPRDFRGQLYDLLQDHSTLSEQLWPLDETRSELLGRTRILIIQPPLDATSERVSSDPLELSEEEDNWLTKLCIFRFGFTYQAALAVTSLERAMLRPFLNRLISCKLAFRHRGLYHVRRDLRRGRQEMHSAEDHWVAMGAFNPMLFPDMSFVSSNRDRVLNHEEIGEALWHLQQHIRGSPISMRQKAGRALQSLMLLRAETDWDTVQRLRDTQNQGLAIEVACELLNEEEVYRNGHPHPSRFAATIQLVGKHIRNLGRLQQAAEREEMRTLTDKLFHKGMEATDAIYSVPNSIEELEEKERALTKLRSEYAYAIRSYAYHLPGGLGDLDEGDRQDLEAIERTLEELIGRVLGSGENDFQGVVLSRAWLTEKRKETKDGKDRLRYAGAAALSHQTWPAAWIELFSLMVFDQTDTGLVADYLNKVSQEATDRIKNSYIRSSPQAQEGRREAILNLFEHLPQLQGKARNSAFALISALGFQYEFVRLLGTYGLHRHSLGAVAMLFTAIDDQWITDLANKRSHSERATANIHRLLPKLGGLPHRRARAVLNALNGPRYFDRGLSEGTTSHENFVR